MPLEYAPLFFFSAFCLPPSAIFEKNCRRIVAFLHHSAPLDPPTLISPVWVWKKGISRIGGPHYCCFRRIHRSENPLLAEDRCGTRFEGDADAERRRCRVSCGAIDPSLGSGRGRGGGGGGWALWGVCMCAVAVTAAPSAIYFCKKSSSASNLNPQTAPQTATFADPPPFFFFFTGGRDVGPRIFMPHTHEQDFWRASTLYRRCTAMLLWRVDPWILWLFSRTTPLTKKKCMKIK